MTSGTDHQQNRLFGIEYLRFLLAGCVVVYHYFYVGPAVGVVPGELFWTSHLVYGGYAVAAFFIISGYVISLSSVGKTASQFFASRVSRLYPALFCCTLMTGFIFFASGGMNNSLLIMTSLKSLAFLPMLGGGKMIDPAYWSIVYELRFYSFVMLLILAGSIDRVLEMLTLFVFVGAGLVLLGLDTEFAAYVLFPYAPFFALGVILFRRRDEGWTPYLKGMLALHFVAAVHGGYFDFGRYDMLDVSQVAIWGMTIVVAVSLALVIFAENVTVPEHFGPFAILLGGMSYPLYLLHQAVGYICIDFMSRYIGAPAASATMLIAVLLASFFVYRFIERSVGKSLKRGILSMLPPRGAALPTGQVGQPATIKIPTPRNTKGEQK